MKNVFVLRSVEDFAAGAFENTAVDEGGIQLGRRGTGHLSQGTYTSQPFATCSFRVLIPSWNVDTPPGTSIELQVRVQAQGEWSEWVGFGHWSSFQDRSSPTPQEYGFVKVSSERLSVLPQTPSASAAQIRVHLHTEEEKKTPTVLLMAVSVLPDKEVEEREAVRERMLAIPMYASLVRDPLIAEKIADATALSMLMNRWGVDILPEEVARGSFDMGAQTYSNLSFLSAIGGIYDFISYVGFGGLDALRHEIWRGDGVAAQVCYKTMEKTAAAEGQEPESLPSESAEDGCPAWEKAVRSSKGHLVVVRGFIKKNMEEYIVFNDPLETSNEAVMREVPLSQFRKMYQGIFLVLRRSKNKHKNYRPQRELVQIKIDEEEILAFKGEEQLIPGRFSTQELDRSTLCYTVSNDTAYASAAQKTFYYVQADEGGRVKVDKSGLHGKRVTFYRIGPGGYTWVGEKWVEKKEEQ